MSEFWQFADKHATGLGFLLFLFIITLPAMFRALRGKGDQP